MKRSDPAEIGQLIRVALGTEKADLVISGGDVLNVYSGELMSGQDVAVKGQRIAYVGESARHAVGPDTEIIDATGKTVIPGLINGHVHVCFIYSPWEFARYAAPGGTTSAVTETEDFAFPLGYRGVKYFLDSLADQPVRFFATAPSMFSMGQEARHLNAGSVRRLLRKNDIVGLSETHWFPVVGCDPRLLELFATGQASGKRIEGHSIGARGNRLVAYFASGASSCHEASTYDEVIERVRLGARVMIKGANLEQCAGVREAPFDLRRVMLVTDNVTPQELVEHGCMAHVVQTAIDLGFNPITAIQMATINAAEHFSLDHRIGGIAPGREADIAVVPSLQRIEPEVVIKGGQIIARDGRLVVEARHHVFPKAAMRSVVLPRALTAQDFDILAPQGQKHARMRAIEQVTDLVTAEAVVEMSVSDGRVEVHPEGDIARVAVVDRCQGQGSMFVGLIKGFGLRGGAVATSIPWDATSAIVEVGVNGEDMALAVNRIREMQGGIVVVSGGQVSEDLALPICGIMSNETMEVIAERLEGIRRRLQTLGCPFDDPHLTLSALTTPALPRVRVYEGGLVDVKTGQPLDLWCS